MAIQLSIWERRDSGDREALGKKALEICRLFKASEGIRSSRFYWHGPDTIVFITEGEAKALNAPFAEPQQNAANYARLTYEIADLARSTHNWQLLDPKTGVEAYRMAGRSK